MPVFAVIQPKAPFNPSLEGKIEAYPYLKIREGIWLIEAKTTAQDVSEQLGSSSGETGTAIILKVSSYYGRAETDVWDWIQAHWE